MPRRFNAEGEWTLARVAEFTGLTPRQITARVTAGTFPAPRVSRIGKLWDAQTVANRWGPGEPVPAARKTKDRKKGATTADPASRSTAAARIKRSKAAS